MLQGVLTRRARKRQELAGDAAVEIFTREVSPRRWHVPACVLESFRGLVFSIVRFRCSAQAPAMEADDGENDMGIEDLRRDVAALRVRARVAEST